MARLNGHSTTNICCDARAPGGDVAAPLSGHFATVVARIPGFEMMAYAAVGKISSSTVCELK